MVDASARMKCAGPLCLAALFWSLTAASSSDVHAQQPQAATAGVYTEAQATRGETISQSQCIACHGERLAGDIAPPLVGREFLSVWDKQPLSGLFDKIRTTMPADALGTLTRPQTADLLAYILKANDFPAGTSELGSDDAVLKQISLARTAAASSSSAPASPQ
jgi:mono/diheme cytochrome c family protein